MPTANDEIVARLEAIVTKGTAVLGTYRPGHTVHPGEYRFATIDRTAMSEFEAQALSCLVGALGEGHVYVQQFKAAGTGRSMHEKEDVEQELGVLRAALEDATNGYLLRTARVLLAAELLSDMTDQPVHLIENGYYIPGASLLGAVLESGLREAARKRGVSVRPRDDLSTLNQKCADANVYTVIQRKRVEVWAGIRNHADHGHFNDIAENDVRVMSTEVQTFLATLLA